MTHFNDLAAKVKPYMGTKFGHFGASQQGIKDKSDYQKSNPERYDENGVGYKLTTYFDKDGKAIASTEVGSDGQKVKYTIFDHTTGATYTTDWGNKSNTKFSEINLGDYSIFDSNGNGVVDSYDHISWVGEGPGVSLSLGSLLGNV